MIKLIILNVILIGIIVFILIIAKKKIISDKAKRLALIISSILTIVCHYSSIIYHLFTDGTSIDYLKSNPNLILPIYPCNVVMWSCLVYGLVSKYKIKIFEFLTDFIFLFGILACLVGLFANVDFIRNPSLKDYDVLKGILAHGFMMLNVLLIPTLGYFKLNLKKNIINIVFSILLLLIIGLYCNLCFRVLTTEEYAYSVNSMFLIHSPFEGVNFLTFPFISVVAIVGYSSVLFVLSKIIKKDKKC